MNRAFTTDRPYLEHTTPLRKAQYALLVVALVAAGYEADRYAVLEPKPCEGQREEMECRKAEWVGVYLNALALHVDLADMPDVNECAVKHLESDALSILEESTYASLTTGLTGTNNDVVWTAKTIGSFGNVLRVSYIDPSGNNQALAVSVVGTEIRVSLATGAGGAITSTASQIIAAVAAHVSAKTLIGGTLATSNNGTGIVTAMAATNLSGGTDA